MRKITLLIILFALFSFCVGVLAQDNQLPDPGLTPDSPFYFLKSWKESIQTFFTFGAENKAKQFLHLAEVRLAEYQKMIEKGKTEIAQRTLEKYEKQLNHALEKADQAKETGKDVTKLKEEIGEKILKHKEILEGVLEKVPETGKERIEKGLQIALKDVGFPEVKYLQPTIKEVQLQDESGKWTTIWSSPDGKTVKLTPDGAEVLLDIVQVEAGAYIGTKLMVRTIEVEVDINRDGDTSDKNVEIILTEAEFQSLPQKEKPQAPQKPQAPEKPEAPKEPEAPEKPQPPEKPQAPQKPQAPKKPEAPQEPERPTEPQAPTGREQQPPEKPQEPERPPEPQQPEKPPEPQKPEEPPEPSAPPEPQAPYRIKGGLVYTGEYLDEKHTVTLSDYIVPLFGDKFIYGGSGGKIIYDFTLHPLLPKHEQISVEVSTESPPPLVLTLSALEVSSASVIGDTILVGTVTLSGPAPSGGQVVQLSATPKDLLILPASVTIEAGATSGKFNISTKAVTSPVNVTVIAELGDSKKNAQITINPTTIPVLSSLTLSPPSVIGGVNSVGTVTLSGPAPSGGQVVQLSATPTGSLMLPASVTLKAGETSGTFNIQTNVVAAPAYVTIAATLDNSQKNASLIISPIPAYCPYNCRPATRERSGWSTSWVTKCGSNEIQVPSSCPPMEQSYSCGLFGMKRCWSRVPSICCKSK